MENKYYHLAESKPDIGDYIELVTIANSTHKTKSVAIGEVVDYSESEGYFIIDDENGSDEYPLEYSGIDTRLEEYYIWRPAQKPITEAPQEFRSYGDRAQITSLAQFLEKELNNKLKHQNKTLKPLNQLNKRELLKYIESQIFE